MSKKTIKKELLLIAIALVLVMFDLALLTSQIEKLQKEISNLEQQKILSIKKRLKTLESNTKLIGDPETGWQIYRAEIGGYKIKIPPKWQIEREQILEEEHKLVVVFSGPESEGKPLSLEIKQQLDYTDLKFWKIDKKETVKKNDTNLYKVYWSIDKNNTEVDASTINYKVILTSWNKGWNEKNKKNDSGNITFKYPEDNAQKYEKLLDKIIDGFEFLDQESKPPDYRKQIEVEEELINKGDGWVTYRNKTQGYEISYPETWYNSRKNNPAIHREPNSTIHSYTIINDKNAANYHTQPIGSIEISVNISNASQLGYQSLKNWVYNRASSIANRGDLIKVQNIQIDNYDAVSITHDIWHTKGENSGPYYQNIYIVNNDKLYSIRAQTNQEKYFIKYDETWQKIFKSFKFINPKMEANNSFTINPKTGWEIYKNDTFGFEVAYPPNWITESPAFSDKEQDAIISRVKGSVYYVLGLALKPHGGEWPWIISINVGTIDEKLNDLNYVKKLKIKNKEKILLNDLVAEKITFSNNIVSYYVQNPDNSLTIGFHGFSNNEQIMKIINTLKFFD